MSGEPCTCALCGPSLDQEAAKRRKANDRVDELMRRLKLVSGEPCTCALCGPLSTLRPWVCHDCEVGGESDAEHVECWNCGQRVSVSNDYLFRAVWPHWNSSRDR